MPRDWRIGWLHGCRAAARGVCVTVTLQDRVALSTFFCSLCQLRNFWLADAGLNSGVSPLRFVSATDNVSPDGHGERPVKSRWWQGCVRRTCQDRGQNHCRHTYTHLIHLASALSCRDWLQFDHYASPKYTAPCCSTPAGRPQPQRHYLSHTLPVSFPTLRSHIPCRAVPLSCWLKANHYRGPRVYLLLDSWISGAIYSVVPLSRSTRLAVVNPWERK